MTKQIWLFEEELGQWVSMDVDNLNMAAQAFVVKYGEGHIIRVIGDAAAFCGRKATDGGLVFELIILQENPSYLENIPFCKGCLQGIPQMGAVAQNLESV